MTIWEVHGPSWWNNGRQPRKRHVHGGPWAEMDDDIDLILKKMVFMSTKHRLKGLNEIVYQYGLDKFGTMVGHAQRQQAKGLTLLPA